MFNVTVSVGLGPTSGFAGFSAMGSSGETDLSKSTLILIRIVCRIYFFVAEELTAASRSA